MKVLVVKCNFGFGFMEEYKRSKYQAPYLPKPKGRYWVEGQQARCEGKRLQ